jgi:replicative DNA helicase
MSDFQEIESLPNSRQAEEAVIGSVLIYSEAYHEASKHINSDDFYVMRNQWIWDALGNLIRAHKPVDLLTLSEELESKDKLSEVGGQAYLLSLINATPSAMHAAEYAKEILEYSIRRTAIQSAHELVKLA